MISAAILCLLFNVFIYISAELDGLQLCQSNCGSSDRLTGPTRPPHTRTHPWKVASFPTTVISFCKLGCQYFFATKPTNETCIAACDHQYRYRVTTGYSDTAEVARLECEDGCRIALQVCQAGYYCTDGIMTPCPVGKFRESVSNISIVALHETHACINCPYGRYRALNKGKSANECSLCPVAKYANVTGSIKESDCLRCPAGKFASEEGSRLCKCIDSDSCDETVFVGDEEKTFYKNDVDYYRETVPFIGRW